MKVALFTETFLPQINGVVRTLEKIIKHLEDNGHEVLLITIGDDHGEEFYSKTRVLRIKGIKFALYKELYLVEPEDKWLRKLLVMDLMHTPFSLLQTLIPSKHSIVKKELADFKPDLVHLATPATLGAIGMYYVDEMKLPCLATFHTDLAAYAPMYQLPYVEEIINAITKLIYSRTDRILCPSPSTQKQLEEIGLKNIGVFGRGVDHSLYRPEKCKKQVWMNYGLDPEKRTILYVGRLAEEKSIPELIDAFLEIKREIQDIQLVLIGDGPAREQLEIRLNEYTNDFVFTGIKKGDELAELYASADLFAFPSRTETFGQVVLEAMASGLPVIGYDSPGVRDLILDQESGILCDVFYGDFRDAIKKLLNDPAQVESFGQKARELSLERSWQKILDGLVVEYTKLVKVHV